MICKVLASVKYKMITSSKPLTAGVVGCPCVGKLPFEIGSFQMFCRMSLTSSSAVALNHYDETDIISRSNLSQRHRRRAWKLMDKIIVVNSRLSVKNIKNKKVFYAAICIITSTSNMSAMSAITQ